MLLLDEPTNHLDAESVAWLERYLEEYPSTVIAVTHDRYFLDNVAEWILELDRGHGIPWHGNYSSWLEQKEQRLALEEREQRGAAQDARARARVGARRTRRRRQAKSKARLQRYEELASREFQERNETNEIYIPPGRAPRRSGDRGRRTAQGLRRAAADRQPSASSCRAAASSASSARTAPARPRCSACSPAPKQPDAGEIRIGPTRASSPTSISRARRSMTRRPCGRRSPAASTCIKVGNYETPSRGYVGRFNFKGAQQQQLIGELSGGERNRVHLAKVLRAGGNVLLLDEPTNDLDVETLRALEEALLSFPRLRRGDLARPLVPRPHRDAHPRLRRRLAGRVVRGQLPGVRRGLQAPQGRGRRAAASHPLQAADPLTATRLVPPMSAPRPRRRASSRALLALARPARRAAGVRRRGAGAASPARAPARPQSVFAHLHAIPRRQVLAALGFTARELLAAHDLRGAGARLPAGAPSPTRASCSPPSSPTPSATRSASRPSPAPPSASACMPPPASAPSTSPPSPPSAACRSASGWRPSRACRCCCRRRTPRPCCGCITTGRSWSARCCSRRWPPTRCGRAWRAPPSRSAAGRCARRDRASAWRRSRSRCSTCRCPRRCCGRCCRRRRTSASSPSSACTPRR